MTVLISGSIMLFLLVCQVHKAGGVKNAEINTRSDFQKRLDTISEIISRNPGNFDKWPKTFQPGIPKRRNGLISDGTPSTSNNEEKTRHVRMNYPQKIHTKVQNQATKETKDRFESLRGFKRISKAAVQKSPCPAENPACERKRTVLPAGRISYQCPTGLWCAKKRNYRLKVVTDPGEPRVKRSKRIPSNDHKRARIEKETTENFEIMPQTPRRCTSELGCSESHGEKEQDESSNRLLQGHIPDQGKRQCPVGLWCSSKREAGFENSETLKKCPPGLWCKRNEIQLGQYFNSKRASMKDGRQCPTGLWCSRKREKGYANFETMSDCPPGLWCKRDKIMPVEMDIPKRELEYENSETLRNCPPGLWCKKNTIDDIIKVRNVKVSCPTGFRCSFKRYMGYENSDTLEKCPPGSKCRRSEQRDSDGSTEQDCPPGLWCKRNGGKIREATNQSVDCADVSWCLLKRKLGIENKDSLVKSK